MLYSMQALREIAQDAYNDDTAILEDERAIQLQQKIVYAVDFSEYTATCSLRFWGYGQKILRLSIR